MKTIYLHGHLKEQFGPCFRLDVASVAEALCALEANFSGKFYNSIKDGSYRVCRALIENGMSPEELQLRVGSKEIHIVPTVRGAKGGGKSFFQVILGVTLIAAAVAFAPAAVGAGGLFGANLGATAFFGITYGQVALFGVSLALSGVSSLLSPTAKVDSGAYSGRESPDERPSFIFNGAVNTSEQGGPVPYIFGEVETGSVLINGSLTPEKLAV